MSPEVTVASAAAWSSAQLAVEARPQRRDKRKEARQINARPTSPRGQRYASTKRCTSMPFCIESTPRVIKQHRQPYCTACSFALFFRVRPVSLSNVAIYKCVAGGTRKCDKNTIRHTPKKKGRMVGLIIVQKNSACILCMVCVWFAFVRRKIVRTFLLYFADPAYNVGLMDLAFGYYVWYMTFFVP